MRIRKAPLVCLCMALVRLLTGVVRTSRHHADEEVKGPDNNVFRIFRSIHQRQSGSLSSRCVFVVSFRFTHLSHHTNKVASLIPMLLIVGFPGFVRKLYAVNEENGHWMGMYEWESIHDLEAYIKSFVFRVMNKRALPASTKMMQWENSTLEKFIQQASKSTGA